MTRESRLTPRHLSAELNSALTSARIVNIVGPRQAGKTTFVRDLFGSEQAGAKFVTLDDADLLAAIENDPAGQLSALMTDIGDNPLIIDEAQRSKKMALAIKKIVDENRRKGQFILTGSSNVFTTLEVADSLAGRMRTIKLWPLTVSEIKNAKPNRLLDWGISKSPKLTDIGKADKLSTLRRMIDQLAARTANEINVTTLTKLLGMSRVTADDYLDVLTRLSMIVKLRAWTSSESKRDIKQAKYHFADTGIAAALRQMTPATFDFDADPSSLGAMLESFVHGEILKSLPYQQHDFRLYHWRSSHQKEIDILAESATRLVGIEVKASSTIDDSDLKHLRSFAKDGPGKSRQFTGIVFYLGEHKLTFGDNIFALPVSSLWGAK